MLTNQVVLPKTRHIAAVGSLYYLFFFLAFGAFAPFLNVYFSELGLTGQQIGWLSALAPLMTLLATPIASLADKRRWRVRIAQTSITGLAVLVFLLRFPTTFSSIIVIVFFFAIFASPIMSLADSLIARMASRHHLNYGRMRLWGSIGFASSALIFGAVWQRTGFRPMFLVCSLILLPLVFVTGKLEEGPRKDKNEPGSPAELIKDTGLVLLLASVFLAGIAMNLSFTFEGIYVRSLGGSNFLIGLMVAFSAYSELPTMFFANKIGKRLQGVKSVILSYALLASAYFGYVLLANPNIMPLFSVLKGLGFGLFFPSAVRIITERTPEKWAATAQSLMTVGMFGLAPLVAGPLGGYFLDAFSPTAVFKVGIWALGLAIGILWFASYRGNYSAKWP